MRPIWTGTISFVLVNIPVRLYNAVSSRTVDFDLLHKKDLAKIRYAKICQEEEKEVSFKDIIRGYEYRKNNYVVVTDEELKKIDPKKNYSIEILSFVKIDDIDPNYYEKPYYLEPDRGGERSYRLFLQSLEKTNKIAVAKFILRNREHLTLIRPVNDMLILNLIRFPSEINKPEINLPKSEASSTELELAATLIEKMTTGFQEEKYHNDYFKKVMNLIEAKIQGQKIKVGPAPVGPTKVEDLMKKLKQSLNESEKVKTK